MDFPTRMCVSCKKRANKNDFIRISCNNGQAVVDNQKQQTARAIYVCKNEKCIDILKKSKAIQRLLKANSDDAFYDNLKNLI